VSSTADTAATARRLVDANMYMTLGTADAEGRPWVSPVWYARAGPDALLWVSKPQARHSRNIAVRAQVAIVIYDSSVPVGRAEAVYLEAVAEELDGQGMERALAVYSEHGRALGLAAWTVDDVREPARFRLYRANVTATFVLGPGDQRLPVTPLS
jgi:uncharacterized protein YhbP (UPF0306 family)